MPWSGSGTTDPPLVMSTIVDAQGISLQRAFEVGVAATTRYLPRAEQSVTGLQTASLVGVIGSTWYLESPQPHTTSEKRVPRTVTGSPPVQIVKPEQIVSDVRVAGVDSYSKV